MNYQNLIIYKFKSLYLILKEIEKELNFKIIEVDNEKLLDNTINYLKNYLIIVNKKTFNHENEYILNDIPIKFSKLIEKINIKLLKQQSSGQSEIIVGKYKINLNSREFYSKEMKLKLTEKEINTILYLSRSNKPIGVEELQTNVWAYQSSTETHTVETHIYRLRKKILDKFKDENFIINEKNGYKIK